MFSETDKENHPTAAWRLSGWTILVLALGITCAFGILHSFVSGEIRSRSDAWLRGEAKVLGQVAEKTAKDGLYDQVVGEVAELATKEVPDIEGDHAAPNESVVFLDTTGKGQLKLWVGKGDGSPFLSAISSAKWVPDEPLTIRVPGASIPFRVVCYITGQGDHIYLGLSEAGFQAVMRELRSRFILLWMAMIALGFAVVFFSTKHMLNRVQRITETASRIGRDDLRSRVPQGSGNDEISRLASTLNHMLDRIESSVQQLHTITDSLAHDLKSPITAIRGQLEGTLSNSYHAGWTEPVAHAVEELDRLAEFLNQSLDVAEANAGALYLHREVIDLSVLLTSMVELYEPCMSELSQTLKLMCPHGIRIEADAPLIHRMMANLFDNEMRHTPSGSAIRITLAEDANTVRLTIEDDGLGFPSEILGKEFERFSKGNDSKGRGMGLAFVKAVVRAHDGLIVVENAAHGGARICVTLKPCRPNASNDGATTDVAAGVQTA